MSDLFKQSAFLPLSKMLEPRRRRATISAPLHEDEAQVLQAIYIWRERRGLETTKADFLRKCILLAIKADPNEALAIPSNSELKAIIDELNGTAPPDPDDEQPDAAE